MSTTEQSMIDEQLQEWKESLDKMFSWRSD